MGAVEACRQLGIGRKTGYRWRAENGGLRPLTLPERAHSGRCLSLLERQRIAALRRDGLTVRAIATLLNRSPSTISRELRRNTASCDPACDGELAHSRARERARRPRRGRLLANAELRARVQAKLKLAWSPEQIAAWLRTEFPDRRAWHVCHETICQALYRGGRGGLARELTKRLRTGRPLRKRRRRPGQRQPRFANPGTPIDRRPAIVAERTRIGDGEGDLILGRGNRSAIATLVCRTSRYLQLVHLPHGHAAGAVSDALAACFGPLPAAARLTLTWDQGTEMAQHHRIAEHRTEGVFFAHPGSPWLRGTNENTNGLLRQYFPKGTDLSVHTAEDLRQVEHRLNHRPRKRLGWRTPADIFTAALAP
ncbi:IS30 family transposase [Amycolatopsis sp. NPDC059090]|uniref:IS30 family transposase n=1 Tax=Amycolatopsis sp. NPDC059090 TaxID=3346723 RepID=UPI00366DBDA6